MQPTPPISFDSAAPSSVAGTGSTRRKRPFGLYMILALLTLQALFGSLVAAVFGIGFVVAPGELWPRITPAITELVVPAILLVLTAVVVFGLWRYRLWGWYGMMLMLAYYMASDAISYYFLNPDYFSMMLNVVMVFYLNQREVRELFETPDAGKVAA